MIPKVQHIIMYLNFFLRKKSTVGVLMAPLIAGGTSNVIQRKLCLSALTCVGKTAGSKMFTHHLVTPKSRVSNTFQIKVD